MALFRRRPRAEPHVAAAFLEKPAPVGPRRPRPTEYVMPMFCQIPELPALYRQLFGNLRVDGTFVEIGAYDGEAWSNTSGLADLGWTGLYVEAVPEFAERCAGRHARNKRISVASCAVGRTATKVDLHLGEGLTTVSSELVAVYQQIEWTKGLHPGDHIEVAQLPLEDLLRAARIPVGFDLLVVDVEGAEDAVFDSFSLEVWKPTVLIVELIDRHPDFQAFDDLVTKAAALRHRIIQSGYEEYHADEINTIFRRDA